MNAIVERENDRSNSVVINDEVQVSMKLVQQIYSEITGKTERLQRNLSGNHKIKLNDIIQLNIKIEQLFEQYNLVAKNCSVVVYHVDDCSARFSSFDRFRLYDQSIVKPCENISLVYDFLIILPGTSKPQSYKISIDLHSRAGMKVKSANDDIITKRFFTLFAAKTGQIQIEYVDYTVARNFLTTINDWYESLDKSNDSKLIRLFQRCSSNFHIAFQVFTILLLSIVFYRQILINTEWVASDSQLLSIVLILFCTIYSSSILAKHLGIKCEEMLELYHQLSYVELNCGDKKTIDSFNKSNFKVVLNSFLTILFMVIINIFSSYIFEVLKASQ